MNGVPLASSRSLASSSRAWAPAPGLVPRALGLRVTDPIAGIVHRDRTACPIRPRGEMGKWGAEYRDFRRRCVFPVVVSNESSVRTPAATARAIDMPLEALPSLDEHSVEIEAPAEAAWQALFPTLEE